MTIKKALPDLLAILAFVIISFLYFFPADTEGRILFQHDSAAGVGASHEVSQYHEATGERSRWTNAIFGGMPTYQIAPSYDSARPLQWVQKAWHLWLPDYVRLSFIMLLGFYLLMRVLGARAGLAAVGAVAWAFSSYFFILISAGHIWKFITLAYIPPTIAGIVLAYKGRYLWGGAVAALFVALQISSNHVQMTYYFLFLILALVIAYGVQAWREKRMPRFWRASGVLAVAALIGVCANLSNLYHTYTYSKHTMRGKSELVQTGEAAKQTSSGLDRDYITQWSYGIDETWTLLVPDYKGGASTPLNQSETAMQKANPMYAPLYGSFTQYFGSQPMTAGPVYVGAFVLMLALLGCFVVKGPLKWALVAATLLSILLSWGKNFMPLTDFFIDYVPMYNKFRAVSSILVVAEFTLPLLAILALKRILEEPGILKREKRGLGISLTVTAGVALLLWLWPGLFGQEFVTTQENAMLQQAVAGQMIPAQELAGIVKNLGEMRAHMVSSDALRSLIIIGVGCLFLWLHASGRLRTSLTVGGIALLCLIDLWGVNKRYLNDSQFVPRSTQATTFSITPTDEAILQDKDPDYRVLNLATSTFNENNTAYHHKSVGGYHAAKLRRYQEMIEHHIQPEMQALYREVARTGGEMDSVDATKFRVLNMLNTRYFIFPTGEQGTSTFPLQNPHALGNAWFVEHVEYVDNANQEIDAIHRINPALTAVADKQFQPMLDTPSASANGQTNRHNEAQVQAKNGEPTQHDEAQAQTNGGQPFDKSTSPSASAQAAPTISLTEYRPDYVKYQTKNDHDAVAVFSEIYYPEGWHVTIDGTPAPLARANYILRALRIPAGEHTVEMHFDPKSLHVTEAIAYSAIALLFILLLTLTATEVRRMKH